MRFSRTRRIWLIYPRESLVCVLCSVKTGRPFCSTLGKRKKKKENTMYPCSFSSDALSCPSANYSSGWSHGKEALKSGSYDTLKGSYYANCAFYQGKGVTVPSSVGFPEFTAPNVWPAETSLPGFQATLEELCTLIIDTAVLVARACDQYAVAHIQDYEPGYLERVVKSSTTTKARLLHYFPPAASSKSSQATNIGPRSPVSMPKDDDSWCATHIDRKLSSLMQSLLSGTIFELQEVFQPFRSKSHPTRLSTQVQSQ